MTETIDRCNKIILWLGSSIAHNQLVEYGIVRISKENWLNVGIVHTNMLHTVLFLIATGQLVLLDTAGHIIIGMSANYKTVLRLTVHCLCIDVVMLLLVLNQPTFILELLEIFGSLLIDLWVILAGANRKIDLWLNDVIETLFVVASLCAGFLRIQYIIGTALNLFYKLFWWANATKWFYCCHRFIYEVLITDCKGKHKKRKCKEICHFFPLLIM